MKTQGVEVLLLRLRAAAGDSLLASVGEYVLGRASFDVQSEQERWLEETSCALLVDGQRGNVGLGCGGSLESGLLVSVAWSGQETVCQHDGQSQLGGSLSRVSESLVTARGGVVMAFGQSLSRNPMWGSSFYSSSAAHPRPRWRQLAAAAGPPPSGD